MAKTPAQVAQTEIDDEAEAGPEGVRARRVILTKHFLPPEGIDWLMKNVVAGGKGTQAMLGRVFGVCTGFEDRPGSLPDGTPTVSIALKGVFQTENYLTGEVSEGVMWFPPAAYAEKVRTIFVMGAQHDAAGREINNVVKAVDVDCDLGAEATGKTIPYEWVLIAFREGQEMATLRNMRRSRKRPAFVLKSGDKEIKAIERPAEQPLPMLGGPAVSEEVEAEAVGDEPVVEEQPETEAEA
jgi:hypothetical protein